MVKPCAKTPVRQLFVEGGGDRNPSLASECRRAFSQLLEKASVGQRPRVIACGGRKAAYDQFCIAHRNAKAKVWLLVDAEDCIAAGPPCNPWDHVKNRPGDHWERPDGATDDQLHFMNVSMETWLIADRTALVRVFGPKLDKGKLPAEGARLETQPKRSINDALKAATKSTPAKRYGKKAHSFKVLAVVSPEKLRPLSWANRFLNEMGAP
jgi:hypothetical protein